MGMRDRDVVSIYEKPNSILQNRTEINQAQDVLTEHLNRAQMAIEQAGNGASEAREYHLLAWTSDPEVHTMNRFPNRDGFNFYYPEGWAPRLSFMDADDEPLYNRMARLDEVTMLRKDAASWVLDEWRSRWKVDDALYKIFHDHGLANNYNYTPGGYGNFSRNITERATYIEETLIHHSLMNINGFYMDGGVLAEYENVPRTITYRATAIETILNNNNITKNTTVVQSLNSHGLTSGGNYVGGGVLKEYYGNKYSITYRADKIETILNNNELTSGTNIYDDLRAERARAIGAENALSDRITTEVGRATGAESALSARINTNAGNIGTLQGLVSGLQNTVSHIRSCTCEGEGGGSEGGGSEGGGGTPGGGGGGDPSGGPYLPLAGGTMSGNITMQVGTSILTSSIYTPNTLEGGVMHLVASTIRCAVGSGGVEVPGDNSRAVIKGGAISVSSAGGGATNGIVITSDCVYWTTNKDSPATSAGIRIRINDVYYGGVVIERYNGNIWVTSNLTP